MKEHMITRTLHVTVANVFCAKPDTQETARVEVTLPGVYNTERKLMKAVRDAVIAQHTGMIPVSVDNAVVIDKAYVMPESTFVQYAQEVEPRVKKAKETENAE